MAKNYDCPICGQYMDFIVTTFRSKPFIDGQTYARMCFCCANVPKEYEVFLNPDGTIEREEGPYFSHRHLQTPQELVDGQTADTLKEAEKSVECVKRACRAVGAKALDKLKLSRPKPEYEQNPDYDARQREKWSKVTKATKRKRS